MTTPADIHETVSRALSTVIEETMRNYEIRGWEGPTLDAVRLAATDGLLARLAATGRIHGYEESSLNSELGELIERHGGDALAVRFFRPRASEDLSTVIEAAMNSAEPEQPPSLGSVRDAMELGLVAGLVGHGEIDADDEQTLLEEISSLIDAHGPGALAEEFLR
jgi:hypothetical protein